MSPLLSAGFIGRDQSAYQTLPSVAFPSAEVIDSLQELVIHMHSAGHSMGGSAIGGGGGQYRPPTSMAGPMAAGALPAEVLSPHLQQLQRPLYRTLRHMFHSWHKKGTKAGVSSFTVVLWMWRSYLQPWTYYRDQQASHALGLPFKLGANSGRFNPAWNPWLLANLPFYVALLSHIVVCCSHRMVSDDDTERESGINNMGRALRVFKEEPKMLEFIEQAWNAYVAYAGAGASGAGAQAAAMRASGAGQTEAKEIAEAMPLVHSQMLDWDPEMLREALGEGAVPLPPADAKASAFSPGQGTASGGFSTPVQPSRERVEPKLARLDVFGKQGLRHVLHLLAGRLKDDTRRGRVPKSEGLKQLAAAAAVVCHDESLKALLESSGSRDNKGKADGKATKTTRETPSPTGPDYSRVPGALPMTWSVGTPKEDDGHPVRVFGATLFTWHNPFTINKLTHEAPPGYKGDWMRRPIAANELAPVSARGLMRA